MTTPSQANKITFPVDTRTKISISVEIEKIYNRCPETSYLEAICEWASANDVEIDDVPRCLADAIMQKLVSEVSQSRLIKSDSYVTLTLDFLL